MMKLQYFCIFMYFWWLLNFLLVFFCGKLTKPCRHVQTFQLASQQSLASIIKKKNKIFNKTAACRCHNCPLWHEHHHWGICIPGYIFRSLIQARTISPPSWGSAPRWLQAVYRVSNGRPPFNSTEKVLKFTIYDCILRLWKKVWFWWYLSFWL